MRARALAILLAAGPTSAYAADPDLPGSMPTSRETYGFGDTAFMPDNFGFAAVELQGVIHRPTDLDAGPFPLVIILHGRHSTCFDPQIPTDQDPFANASVEWPCAPFREPVPSLDGYDYWAENLASHGYVVVSIGANGVNAADDAVEDAGANARAQLITAHLDLWTAFNDTDEYGTTYNDSVDLQNIGLVGHSRGGEGVAAWFVHAANNDLPYTVRGALLLAPTDFNRAIVTGVPLATILPYCDGDVFDLQGAHYYDDSRHATAGDPAPKYVFEMAGSNHNFYNTIWSPGTFSDGGAVDDFTSLELAIQQTDASCGGASPLRLGEQEQQQSFVAYANAFFRMHLGGETEYVPLLRGEVEPPTGAAAAAVRTTYMPPDLAGDRLVVNRIATAASMATNDLDAAVEGEALGDYGLCGVGPGGGIEDFDHCVAEPGTFFGDPFEGREPHVPGLAHLRLGSFGDGARWINALPRGTDVSGFVALQFRVAYDFDSAGNDGSSAELSVALVDGAGTRAMVGPIAVAPPLGSLYPIVPKLLLYGVRMPLAEFVAVAPTIDLADVASIELVFDQDSGAILLSDLLFADEVPPPPSGTGSSSDDGTVDSSGEDEIGNDSTGQGTTSPMTTNDDDDDDDDDDDGTAGSSDTTGPSARSGDDGCGCTTSASQPGRALLFVIAIAAGRSRRRFRARAR